jgi:hypothetical protein
MNRPIICIFRLTGLATFLAGWFGLASCSQEKVKNSLTEQNLLGKVKSLTETNYPVDSSGKITGKSFLEKTLYRYGARGNKIEEIHYYPDSIPDLITFKYDLSGKKVEKRWLDTNKELNHLAVFRFDKNGNLIEKRWTGTHGSLLKKATFSYDDNGNKTEESINYFADSLNERRTFSFNKQHLLKEETIYNSRGIITHRYSYKYLEFDHTGNWVLRMQSEKDIPTALTIRSIEY